MSQEEILRILKDNYPEFLSYRDIMKLTKLSKSSVQRALSRLCKDDYVQYALVEAYDKRARWIRIYRAKN